MSVYAPKVRNVRTRFTTAQVNAGARILPPVAGQRYRMVDCTLIAIGGNASGATSVDVGGSGLTLVAAAVAGLTRSAVARAGAANIAVLADGASFAPLDAGEGINIGKTGGNLATATAVDVILSYTIE
jgi:hypothetical protein